MIFCFCFMLCAIISSNCISHRSLSPATLSIARHASRITDNTIAQVCLAYSGGLDTSCICMDILGYLIDQLRLLIPKHSEVPH
jgi:hypothetical protein